MLPSSLYLWLAVLIFAASNSVTRKVTDIGAHNLIDGRNPISFCNVLFVGNLCALVVMVAIFGKAFNRRNLGKLSRGDWLSLGAIAVLAGTLAPALIFSALEFTNVTNVVLFTRLEPPIALLLSVMLFGARVNRWTVAGSIVTFIGVGVTALLMDISDPVLSMGGMVQFGRGELFAAAGAIVAAISTVLSKARLKRIPLGVFAVIRTAIGTVVFFIIAKGLFGAVHFADVLSPLLWKWMLLYGTVIVVAGQLCWFTGLRNSTPAQITFASSLHPIAAIAMAYLILGEIPSNAQYIGGGVVAIGILLGLIGNLRDISVPRPAMEQIAMEPTNQVSGFKGV
jgi:drug/metabolite transporter (DMT)-like permease